MGLKNLIFFLQFFKKSIVIQKFSNSSRAEDFLISKPKKSLRNVKNFKTQEDIWQEILRDPFWKGHNKRNKKIYKNQINEHQLVKLIFYIDFDEFFQQT